jgi:ubiquinone/menaquinone biosynthesis C-methylase UbiE
VTRRETPEPPGVPPARVRACYDSIAREYAERFSGELAHKPLDREMLKAFAAEIPPGGLVYDLGCGPGQTTRFLKDLGVDVRGLDLSPKLVGQARQRHRGVEFVVGDMLALPIPDASLAGVVAFYAIVHFSPEQLQAALAEMSRVLVDRGHVLLSFHVGTSPVHVDELLGKPVSIDFEFFDPIEIAADLAVAGFAEIRCEERDPYQGVEFQSRRAYVIARKYPR